VAGGAAPIIEAVAVEVASAADQQAETQAFLSGERGCECARKGEEYEGRVTHEDLARVTVTEKVGF
jgi:hypothetical protein